MCCGDKEKKRGPPCAFVGQLPSPTSRSGPGRERFADSSEAGQWLRRMTRSVFWTRPFCPPMNGEIGPAKQVATPRDSASIAWPMAEIPECVIRTVGYQAACDGVVSHGRSHASAPPARHDRRMSGPSVHLSQPGRAGRQQGEGPLTSVHCLPAQPRGGAGSRASILMQVLCDSKSETVRAQCQRTSRCRPCEATSTRPSVTPAGSTVRISTAHVGL